MAHLIDRRENAPNKSAVNRARFLRRYKEQIRRAVHDMVSERSITDMDRGGNVSVPRKDISEPVFRHGPGGDREIVHPGNREFTKGDRIPRPEGGSGEGGGSEPGTGESEDEFVFALSREEFLHIFFEDLELPRLERNMLAGIEEHKPQRAGYTTTGSPTNLAIVRTMRTSLARRIALGGPLAREIEALDDELVRALAEDRPQAELQALRDLIEELKHKLARVPFLDEFDLRYRNRVNVPEPTARAVMFCLMDVSASMDEAKKDLAKRFFTLLYLFLTRKYEHVELVFVRHTDNAEEVDEKTFFYDRKSGGTVVLSALQLMAEIVEVRYASGGWNIYAAQASDGDAFGADAGKSARFLADRLLPQTRYFAYLETPDESGARMSSLWVEYQEISAAPGSFAMRRVTRREEIYPVFRELFRKDVGAQAA
ncbi:MAG: YeaH/YhbH family protein [Burkholderiales bacterium]